MHHVLMYSTQSWYSNSDPLRELQGNLTVTYSSIHPSGHSVCNRTIVQPSASRAIPDSHGGFCWRQTYFLPATWIAAVYRGRLFKIIYHDTRPKYARPTGPSWVQEHWPLFWPLCICVRDLSVRQRRRMLRLGNNLQSQSVTNPSPQA
jgi:hypothetical protein